MLTTMAVGAAVGFGGSVLGGMLYDSSDNIKAANKLMQQQQAAVADYTKLEDELAQSERINIIDQLRSQMGATNTNNSDGFYDESINNSAVTQFYNNSSLYTQLRENASNEAAKYKNFGKISKFRFGYVNKNAQDNLYANQMNAWGVASGSEVNTMMTTQQKAIDRNANKRANQGGAFGGMLGPDWLENGINFGLQLLSPTYALMNGEYGMALGGLQGWGIQKAAEQLF
jgi:hypothetical protein